MMTAGDLNSVKETALAWLPKCPSHWDFVRAKAIFRRMQRPVRPEDGVVTAFRDGIVTLRKNRRTTGFTEALQEIGYQGIRKGDLVIHAMDAFAGAIGVSDSDGKGTPVYSVCQPTGDANSWYYALVLREMSRSGYLLSLAKGIRERSTDFRFAEFASLMVPLPPVEEQEQIVRFVRHLDSKVNRLIKAKRRLIELLNEQKQAIIHQAVTRGLDPNVPLKPSGIEWLGDIPEPWIVCRAKNLFTEVDVRSKTGEEELLTVSSADGIVPRATKTVYMFKAASYIGHKLCWPKDLVINSLWAWAGGYGFSEHHGLVSSAYGVYRLKPDHELYWRYLHNLMRSGALEWQIQIRSKGIWKSRLQLTPTSFLEIPMLLPPAAELAGILNHIEVETSSLNDATLKVSREIDLIREYRTRLVADVVTGQLDVRQHPWANTQIEDSTEATPDDAELEDDLEETDDVLEEAGV